MEITSQTIAPGARIVVRDAEWLVRRVDRTSTGRQALSVIGISELVRDKDAVFLDELEQPITVLKPEETTLVPDSSPSYRTSLLYMESLLKRKPPTDDLIYTGHKAAMDSVDYQFDPAIQALDQPRQRILIADAVGLGKTLEAGILVSELIRRGKGKRILVVALKSMLTQFQKEFWSRFTIPLVRLDSIGIQRIRSRIPTNHNPFYYYDRAIISIDTLKQDSEYRNYLENAWWDIIVIDEAQNVAERGSSSSLRAKLASLLSKRSDTLIMLSATPHDGRAKSFASLMNMLDPTAIADPEIYTRDEIKGLFIRRFKKDIRNQVQDAFREREISSKRTSATPIEEEAFSALVNTHFTRLDTKKTGAILFKTTLQKALFSSPAACLETIRNRIRKLEKTGEPGWKNDINSLKALQKKVTTITPDHFSKYQRLLSLIRDGKNFAWTGKNTADRLVIFTERIDTLKYLVENLTKDLNLKPHQVAILHGSMSDIDQQQVVEDFGREEARVRLLIASDVASEGINLHYLCHRMIHFDIPWSLMVFNQRNGRIDRYGQKEPPRILYLITESSNAKISGDTRILELLIKKDEQAVKNIGDPASFMHVYDIDEEEKITARAIEEEKTAEDFEKEQERKPIEFDPLEILLGHDPPPIGERAHEKTGSLPTLFRNNFSYLKTALDHLNQSERMQYRAIPDEKRIDLTIPPDLKQRYRYFPREALPENDELVLIEDPDRVQTEIAECRKQEKAWPRISFLWPLSPVLDWVNDRLMAAFGRHEAPVIPLQGKLEPGETIFILSGLIPNQKGHPLVHEWFGTRFRNGHFEGIQSLPELLERTELGKRVFPNMAERINIKELTELLSELLGEAVNRGRDHMLRLRNSFDSEITTKLLEYLQELDNLKERRLFNLELKFENSRLSDKIIESRKQTEQREINNIFSEYYQWIEETMKTEKQAWIQVIAVLTGVGN
ncbi:MAG: DEAD/DEAH box helicase [Candidatus Aegiribacteria sp.]|nr:DEAD/DEAH box helicase [Candidatus Aegiribacteria sp.]